LKLSAIASLREHRGIARQGTAQSRWRDAERVRHVIKTDERIAAGDPFAGIAGELAAAIRGAESAALAPVIERAFEDCDEQRANGLKSDRLAALLHRRASSAAAGRAAATTAAWHSRADAAGAALRNGGVEPPSPANSAIAGRAAAPNARADRTGADATGPRQSARVLVRAPASFNSSGT
jgi:hypothetical protein